jgi:hypothetical protein
MNTVIRINSRKPDESLCCICNMKKFGYYHPRKGKELKMKKTKAFTVSSKDLFDKEKNPNIGLSVETVEKNKKIPKKYL